MYTNVAEALLPFSPLDLMLHFRGERPNPNWAIVKGQAGVRGRQNYIRGDDQPAAKERASERFRVGKSGASFAAADAASSPSSVVNKQRAVVWAGGDTLAGGETVLAQIASRVES